MELAIIIVIIILSLILFTQVIALSLQYRINKMYEGIGYWLVASSLMIIAFLLMTLVRIEELKIFAVPANPLLILAYLFFYVGIKKFFNRKIYRGIPIIIFSVFTLTYYYNLFFNDSISMRTIIISSTIALVSFMITYVLFLQKDKELSVTANFTTAAFFIFGSYHLLRIFSTFQSPLPNTYLDQSHDIIIAMIMSLVMSNLWVFGLIIMVNQRLLLENEREREKLQLIFNTNINTQLITRLEDGLIIDVNEEFSRISGYSREEVIDSTVKKLHFWKNIEDRHFFTKELKEKDNCRNKEFVFQRKDGTQFAGMISARLLTIQSVVHIVSVIRDITERKEFEKALIESEEMHRSILDASPDDITITDLEGKIVMISPAAKAMFGYPADYDRFVGMHLFEFIVPEDVERAQLNILQMYHGSQRNTNEYRGIRQDRSVFDIEVNSGIIYDADGKASRMVFIVRDVTDRKIIETKMKKLVEQLEKEKNTAQLNAITDTLTGLFNRGYFDLTLRTEFYRLMRSESPLSLIMLDIDHFKNFNDTYGHLAGDKCIQMITKMLKNTVERASDVAARYGGEEFIVILPETEAEGAQMLGERIRLGVEALAIPHVTSQVAKYVTVSVGVVTVYPKQLDSPEQALKLVDEALYEAKATGRNRSIYKTVGEDV